MINHVNSDIIRHGCVSDQGPKPGKKRKLKCLEDEYFDLGDGYDENDPFIDNTEAVRFKKNIIVPVRQIELACSVFHGHMISRCSQLIL